MASVTARINAIKQPRGGYINPVSFETQFFNDGILLNMDENIPATTIGMAVDYMTRYMMGAEKEDAFKISLMGAMCAEEFGDYNAPIIAEDLIDGINGLDNASIINACQLTGFDVWYRNPMAANMSSGNKANPDEPTIANIRTMIQRSMAFFEKFGPITKDGFTFEPVPANESEYRRVMISGKGSYGGYTPTVHAGD